MTKFSSKLSQYCEQDKIFKINSRANDASEPANKCLILVNLSSETEFCFSKVVLGVC